MKMEKKVQILYYIGVLYFLVGSILFSITNPKWQTFLKLTMAIYLIFFIVYFLWALNRMRLKQNNEGSTTK